MQTPRAIEVGHLFKLGTRYSKAVGATFLDSSGQVQPIVMGSYGIGTGRLMAVIVEENRDEKGIRWPLSVDPYQVHLISLGSGPSETLNASEQLYTQLFAASFEVLYDDRNERAGVKFSDADLIGIPVRIVVSAKTLSHDSIEVKKKRAETQSQIVPLRQLDPALRDMLTIGP